MKQLEGQVALVFGASSGMGLATGRAFARAGAVVAIAARREVRLRELAVEIEAIGGQALPLAADVSDRRQVERAIEAVIARFGKIDILINTAGTNIPQRGLSVLSQANWDRLLATNVTGAFNTIQTVLPHMRAKGGGLIMQISSTSGRWGDWSGAAYQASKHGIVGLCYATMFEERLNGIRVTVLFPGCCDTPILRQRPVPLRREILDKALYPEDIAMACLFLASLPARAYVPELIILPGALQCIGQTVISP
jgi:NAD(P)-dependent dehydrogenase (short-subunit alcohol dehydrogenase family)